MILDGEPHVLDDDLGFRLADVPEVLAAAGFPPGEAWLEHPAMQVRPWRASIVARARLVEDLVADRSRNGLSQVIILGAGLDTFALRHTQEGDALRVFEVHHPRAQHWKQARLTPWAPKYKGPQVRAVRFRIGRLLGGGARRRRVDPASPAVVALAGLTQYLTQDAIQQTMRDVAGGGACHDIRGDLHRLAGGRRPRRPRADRPDSPDKQGTGDTMAEHIHTGPVRAPRPGIRTP